MKTPGDIIATIRLLSVEDHGVFRGRRTWTVRLSDEHGTAQVNAVDVTTELEAVAQARETFASRRIPTDEERAAHARNAEALHRGLGR